MLLENLFFRENNGLDIVYKSHLASFIFSNILESF